jgi:membrane-associated phospholipid phosphatase
MELLWNLFSISNEWVMWIFLCIALVILYFLLRFLIWKKEQPEERVVFKKFLIVFLVSIIISVLVIHGLKSSLQVPRPCVPCLDHTPDCNPYCPESWDYSFPSGHAGTIFVLFTSFFMIYRKKWFLPLFIFPALVAYSRVALGVHTYPDVIGGAILGIIIPVIVWKIEKIYRVFKRV